jgi:hypothetical protein
LPVNPFAESGNSKHARSRLVMPSFGVLDFPGDENRFDFEQN